MSRKGAMRYYLVVLPEGHLSAVEIFEIADPVQVERLENWADEHINRSARVQKSRGLVLLKWHDELLGLDEAGQLVSSDFLSDVDVINERDYATLKATFLKNGKRVGTVPGRKPPAEANSPYEQALIECDESRNADAARIGKVGE